MYRVSHMPGRTRICTFSCRVICTGDCDALCRRNALAHLEYVSARAFAKVRLVRVARVHVQLRREDARSSNPEGEKRQVRVREEEVWPDSVSAAMA